jgi:hypothetical protein
MGQPSKSSNKWTGGAVFRILPPKSKLKMVEGVRRGLSFTTGRMLQFVSPACGGDRSGFVGNVSVNHF